MLSLWRHIAVLLVASVGISLSPLAHSVPRSVLVLHPSDVRGPFYYQVFSALRSTVNATPGSPVTIYVESLDLSRFTGRECEQSLEPHFGVKYRDKPVGVL